MANNLQDIYKTGGITGLAAAAQGKPPLSSLMGNGGANYNTADASTQKSIVDNETKLSDPNFRQSEIARTQGVIANRTAGNMDNTDQNAYLSRLMGMNQAPQTPNASDMISSIYDKNYAAQSQKLGSLRDTQLAGLAGQEDVINQNKVSGLNANDVMATNNLRSLKESMANAGVNGGDSVTAQIGNQTAQQQGAVDINNNASNQLKTLMAQRAAINNNASADDLALMQGLQATRDTQSLADLYKNRDFNYQVGRDAVGDSQWNKSFDYNAGRDQVKDNQFDKTFDYNAGQDQVKNNQWDKQFNYGVQSDQAKMQQAAQQFAASQGIQWANLNQRQKEFVAEQSMKQQQLNAENNPNSLDNQYKLAQINSLNGKNPPPAGIDEYDLSMVDTLAANKGVDLSNPDAIRPFISELKSQYGWTTDEAKKVESYLTSKVGPSSQGSSYDLFPSLNFDSIKKNVQGGLGSLSSLLDNLPGGSSQDASASPGYLDYLKDIAKKSNPMNLFK